MLRSRDPRGSAATVDPAIGGWRDCLAAVARAMEDGRVLALSGAGCSTESGIPDYRDEDGSWKGARPILWREFRCSPDARRRYWARSMLGWPNVAAAAPGRAHQMLAELEQAGIVHWLVTQNVDGLHQSAGSRRVTDLHGRLDTVRCTACGHRDDRRTHQDRLLEANPGWRGLHAAPRPDGDVDLDAAAWAGFRVPRCARCSGMLKPDVVFFGENVPKPVVAAAFRRLERSRLLLVVGSSLAVWSGYRFVRRARELGIPVVIINRGRTRGDGDAAHRLTGDCGDILERLRVSRVETVRGWRGRRDMG